MTPASRGTSPGLVGPTRGVDECGAPGLGSRVRSRFTGIRLIEEPMMNLDDSNFDDFEDSEEDPDLGLEEDPGSLLDYLHARHERVARIHFRLMLSLPLCMELMLHDCLIRRLDCKLNHHRSKVSDLWDQLSKWMDKW